MGDGKLHFVRMRRMMTRKRKMMTMRKTTKMRKRRKRMKRKRNSTWRMKRVVVVVQGKRKSLIPMTRRWGTS